MHNFAFLDKLLATRYPPHFELSVLRFRTDVCEAQEIERFRLALVSSFAILFRETSKLDEPTLFFR